MRIVRSRILIGVGAWLLGAASATVGSLYAVGQLGNSLLAESTKQMSVSTVNADLANENARQAAPLPTATSKPPGHGRDQGRGSRHGRNSASSRPSAGPTPTSAAGVLLTSPDGTAEAACTAAGAYLSYWSPQPGFEADNVVRGPAAVASVVFRGNSGGIKMRVTCQGGVPVKQLVNVGWHDDGGHDE